MAASYGAVANPTINVSGKIAPPACSASIVGGESLDWGSVSHNSLSENEFTVLPAKQATLQVQCEQGLTTHIAFWAVDSNPGSAIAGKNVNGIGSNGNDSNRIFGIGKDPVTGKNIGNFTLAGKTSSYDGTVNDKKYGWTGGSGHNSTAFSSQNMGWGYKFSEDWTVIDDKDKAVAANLFTFTFDVVPQINKKSQITNAQEVPFACKAQFFVRYF